VGLWKNLSTGTHIPADQLGPFPPFPWFPVPRSAPFRQTPSFFTAYAGLLLLLSFQSGSPWFFFFFSADLDLAMLGVVFAFSFLYHGRQTPPCGHRSTERDDSAVKPMRIRSLFCINSCESLPIPLPFFSRWLHPPLFSSVHV